MLKIFGFCDRLMKDVMENDFLFSLSIILAPFKKIYIYINFSITVNYVT